MASPKEMKRLAFIRYLYNKGVDESRLPEPKNAGAVLVFHDAVELFLHLACISKGVKKASDGFMEYWTVLKSISHPDGPQLKEPMRHLNTVRNHLKHDGVFPAKAEIEDIRGDVRAFFAQNTPTVFNVGFDDISLVDFVVAAEVRSSLHKAETHLAQGDTQEAIKQIALAFDQLVGVYRQAYQEGYPWYSPLYIQEDLAAFDALVPMSLLGNYAASEGVAQLLRYALGHMQDAIWFLSLGLDYRRFTRFETLTPRVMHTDDGIAFAYIGLSPATPATSPPVSVTAEDCRFCTEFVIDCAIRLQGIEG